MTGKFPFSVKQIIYCITELKSLNKITFKVIRALQITLLLLLILAVFKAATRQLLTAMAQRAGVRYEDGN